MDRSGIPNSLLITKHANISFTEISDVDELLKCLRPIDIREIEDVGGRTPRENLLLGYLLGEPCLTLRTTKGEMIGILTVVPSAYRAGVIAMVGSKLLEQHQMAFLRGSKDVLHYLDQHYDLLYNICDCRNTCHHKWLKWLGFTFFRLDKYKNMKVPVFSFARFS